MRFSFCLRIHQILSNGLRGLPRSAQRPHGRPPKVPTRIKINVNEDKIMSNSLHSIRFYGFHCIPQHSMEFSAFHRILWIPLDSTVFRALVELHRILSISLDSLRFFGFCRILWISLDSLRFYACHWIP